MARNLMMGLGAGLLGAGLFGMLSGAGFFGGLASLAGMFGFLLQWPTLLTLVMFWFMPAIGPLGYLWQGPVPYMPASELWQPQLFPVLRDHAMRDVDLGHLVGLVSAPSFHTAAALLYIACAWPMARLRWPVVGVNVAMLLSTPVEGTHYLADMLIGALVAGLSWGIVAGVTARRGTVVGNALLGVADARRA